MTDQPKALTVAVILEDGTTWVGVGPEVPGFAGSRFGVTRVELRDARPLPAGHTWGRMDEDSESREEA